MGGQAGDGQPRPYPVRCEDRRRHSTVAQCRAAAGVVLRSGRGGRGPARADEGVDGLVQHAAVLDGAAHTLGLLHLQIPDLGHDVVRRVEDVRLRGASPALGEVQQIVAYDEEGAARARPRPPRGGARSGVPGSAAVDRARTPDRRRVTRAPTSPRRPRTSRPSRRGREPARGPSGAPRPRSPPPSRASPARPATRRSGPAPHARSSARPGVMPLTSATRN